MQYDTIILELLNRIQHLENDVKELKDTLNILTSEKPAQNNYQRQNYNSVPYMKTTDEMIDTCYKYGKKLNEGEDVQELADYIHEQTGMNRNTAIMYLFAVEGMLNGTVYKRAINARAQRRYYDCIYKEFGSSGLKKALDATKLHIEYRRSCGSTVDAVVDIYNSYKNKI